jgi:YspA, cpYpsA-related SLOG family
MRVLITGSRDWNNPELIRRAFDWINEKMTGDPYTLDRDKARGVTIVSGNCPSGADWMCERVAFDYGFTVERHPAQWRRYGRRAGLLRNEQMVARGADICFAFIKDMSKGATHCSEAARDAGIPTVVYRMTGDRVDDSYDWESHPHPIPYRSHRA